MFISFILGLIVGILIRDIKCKTIENVEKIKEFPKKIHNKYATFLEPISKEEKWDNALTIDDLLK